MFFNTGCDSKKLIFLGIFLFCILTFILFICSSVIYIGNEDDPQHIIGIISLLGVGFSFIGSIFIGYKLFFLMFCKKLVNAVRATPVDKSLDLSAFRDLK